VTLLQNFEIVCNRRLEDTQFCSFARLFAKLLRPGNSEVTVSVRSDRQAVTC